MADPSPDVQWSARSVGSRRKHAFFYFLIRWGGRGVAYAFMRIIVAGYILFSPLARERCRPYLRRRFPDSGPLLRRVETYRLLCSLGETLIDRAAFGLRRRSGLRVDFPQRHEFKSILDEGRGMVMVNSHVGNWQTSISMLENPDVRVAIVMTHETGDVDRHYFEHTGERPPFDIIDPRGYLGGVVEMVAALRRGNVLGLMGDRLFGDEKNSVAVPLLGDDVRLPIAPYRLAATTGSPVVVLFSHKTGRSEYRLEIAKVIRVPKTPLHETAESRPYAREFADALEQYVAAHPWQFHNFYDLWQRQEPPHL